VGIGGELGQVLGAVVERWRAALVEATGAWGQQGARRRNRDPTTLDEASTPVAISIVAVAASLARRIWAGARVTISISVYPIAAIAILVDRVTETVGCARVNRIVVGAAVISIEAAVAVKVLQHLAGAVAAHGGKQGEGQQQRGGTHRRILADRAGGGLARGGDREALVGAVAARAGEGRGEISMAAPLQAS
jgi:hypothetical protein